MIRATFGELMSRLRAEGVATDDDVAAVRTALRASDDAEMPVYLRALVGFGAWIATILLVAFFYALRLLDDKTTAVIFGVVLIGGAAWLRRRSRGEFTRHAAVAASFAGQGLILTAIEMFSPRDAVPFIAAALMSLVMIVLMPDVLHRFVSAVILVGSVAAALVAVNASHALDIAALMAVVALAWVWRVDVHRRSDDLTEMFTPVGYGLAIGLFGLCLFGAFYSMVEGARTHAPNFGALTTYGVGLMLSALVLVILREHDTTPSGFAGVTMLVIIALFAALTLKSPGIICGAGMLILGFDRKNIALMELATAFLIVFGAANYYSLNLTLLEKSGVLVASGVLLIVARAFVARLPGARAEASS
ncbi:MAG: DUF4401 domain-containing protein [bacterium]